MTIHQLPDDIVRAMFHALDVSAANRPTCDECDEFITRCDDVVAVAVDDTEEWVIEPFGVGRVTEVTMYHRACLPEGVRRVFEHQARATRWRFN